MDREILTNVTFEENCEYLSSTISKIISIPQQAVEIDLIINNLESNRNNIYYYDDKIQLTAKVYQTYTDENEIKQHFIKTGRVEFYFQPEGSTTFTLINKSTLLNTTCEINAAGSAAVIFKPKSSGIVYAKYIDESDFYTAITDTNPEGISDKQNIVLNEIPVKIDFTQCPPYLTDVHDEVELQVHVTNGLDDTDIQYGTVTFLHYLVKDDIDVPEKRVPKVIGNPVPVINGYAKINYVPVQSDDELEPEILEENGNARYCEYVRASYNYTGKYIDTEKGAYKWKYYDTASKWTGINVLARNSITLNVSLQMSETPDIYQCSENDTITLTALLKDKNDELIHFENHSGDLIFHIKGVHGHPKKEHVEAKPTDIPTTKEALEAFYDEQVNSEFQFIQYENDIIATFSNDEFTAVIDNLLPGFYTITAETTADSLQTDNGDILIQYDEGDVENDKIYAPTLSSNTIYIMSNYDEISNYDINLQCDTGVVYLNSRVNNLKCIITGLSDNEKNILNNKTCKFYVRELNNTYRGTLSYSNGILYGTPTEDIIFNIANNYSIYAYIPSSIYTNNYNITDYDSHSNVHDFYLPSIMSSPIVVQARENIQLFLKIDKTHSTRPAEFSYSLTGKRIVDSTQVQIIIKPVNQSTEKVVDTVTLFRQSMKASNKITIEEAGEYIIYAKSGNISSSSMNITVEKDSLSHELLASSKKIFASVDNTMGIYLTSSDNNIDLLNNNNLHFYIYDKNRENKKEATIQSIRYIDNKTKYIIIRPNIGTEGNWFLKVVYDGDNIFKSYNSELESFETGLDTPTVKLIPSNGTYDVQISSKYNQNNIIAMKVKFVFKNTEIDSGILITDETGYGKIYDNRENVETLQWWTAWDSIVFIFNPYDSELIEILSNNQVPYNILRNKYNYVFDYKNISNNVYLRLQLEDNNNEYIYSGYKKCEIRVPRPNAL